MRTKNKAKAQYRHLLRDAWQTTWQRKELWIFGIAATLMTSGGVLDIALRGFKRVMKLNEVIDQALEGTLPGFGVFADYIRLLPLLDERRVAISLAVIILFALAILTAAVVSQSALLLHAADKKPRSLADLLSRAWRTFVPVFVTDIVMKLCLALATLMTSLPLVLVMFDSTPLNAALYVASFILFFPAVIAINSLGMLTIVGLVRGAKHPVDAFHQSLTLFKKHWLVILELGLVLFAISLFAGLIAAALLLALTIPYTVMTAVVLMTSSQLLYLLSMGLASTVFIAVVLLSAGLITAFQYVVWLRFYERSVRHGIASKLERLWNG